MLFRTVSNIYGQLRGYDRRNIRRQAKRNASLCADDMAQKTSRLLSDRIQEACELFPAYANKVLAHCGDEPIENLQLKDFPIWTRSDQRSLFDSLTEPPVPDAFVHTTGGSTGVPAKFYVTRKSYEWRMAVSDRGYSWAEAEEGRRSFYVWGTQISKPSQFQKLKKSVDHTLQNRSYFDSFEFDDENKAECCRAIDRTRPHAIVGYAGNLVQLALFVKKNPGMLDWKSASIITAAEGLAPARRSLLEEYLGDEVFMSYGSREFMLIGMECREHNGYHISADNLIVEVVDEKGMSLPAGEPGRIVITDLHNTANPFIRYEIGDMGVMSAESCPCGLPFPLLKSVDGRIQEVIELPDGSNVTALFIPHMMKEFDWIDGYQLEQDSSQKISVNLVAADGITPERAQEVEATLRTRVGDRIAITVQKVGGLKKNASGKTPIVILNRR